MNAHKERPILFNGEMVRAILSGSKTQTRRIMKPQPEMQNVFLGGRHCNSLVWKDTAGPDGWLMHNMCPYGKEGDRLWVREAHAIVPRTAYRCSDGVQQMLRPDDDHDAAIYREGWTRSRSGFKWRPSIHMPRWASRITLEIVSVRIEKLQDISRGDAMDEGCPFPNLAKGPDPRLWYAELWDQINGQGSWLLNPFVWIVEFKPVEGGK
jgi:hypothetical protein